MAAKKQAPARLGIEPGQMQVPAMDRPSIALAWFMDSMILTPAEEDSPYLVMVCNLCLNIVCEVSDGDTLRVLFNTALAHNCG